MMERQVNYLSAQIDSIAGMPGLSPTFPPAPATVILEGATLNNIHVSDSQIGVINTGSIGTVDSAVTVIQSEGNNELASAVVALTEAVLESNELANDEKNEVVELIAALSEEAAAPKQQRKPAVARVLLSRLSDALGGLLLLSGIWDKAQKLFEAAFN